MRSFLRPCNTNCIIYKTNPANPKETIWKITVLETHGACTGASGAGVEFEVGAVVGGFVEAGCHTDVK